MKSRTGSIWMNRGKVYARITYVDEFGRRRDVRRRALSRTHARIIIKQLLQEVEERGEDSLDSSRLTFQHLVKHYLERYAIPARYIESRKIAGLRSHKEVQRIVEILVAHFGRKRLRSITHGDILHFRALRLETRVKFKSAPSRSRSIATVNRELTVLRRMLTIAHREGWILKHPFLGSDTLISPADEKQRSRVLTRDEEELLLDACDGPRAKLKAIIICALDTGMRRGEIFKLCWRDVDFELKQIHIQAMNTKTLSARSVPVSARLLTELAALPQRAPFARVFGVTDTVKRSWATAKRIAGINDLRFHDLRHTFATRLVQGGLPIAEVSRILGHTSVGTTFRYANIDDTTFSRVLGIINSR